ncbi:hypothetical protein TrLO_g4847 [Triparma laevis f. longispina]|uniref:Ubiquitin carboxyl-terminal hydrolase n=1 Tax=Triparma laevis f. longispina TaxID=1714387 RepID=A0A9W7FNT3_9STRA|nr:hypothetical protein TrLO_g4847 [Triparma laevis f. longispina]
MSIDDRDIDSIFSKKPPPPPKPPTQSPAPHSPPPITRVSGRASPSTSTCVPAPLSPRSITRQTSSQAVSDPIGSRPRLNSTDGHLHLPQIGLCAEQPVLTSHLWLPPLSQIKKSIGPGLRNLGNTCFLNSTLQCLAYSPVFSQCLLLPPSSNNSGNVKPASRITLILQNLLKTIHMSASNKHTTACNPSPLVSRLRELSKNFKPHRQEDAHEFLIALLSHLQEAELKACGIDSRKSGWRDRMGLKRLDETSLVHRMFGGYLRSQILCTRCGFKSNTYDPFLDLALDISSKLITSLKTALSHHTSTETLDSDNKYKCSGCNHQVCAKKQLTIFRPPLTLIVQLKRFRYSPFGFSRGGGSKISKKIQYSSTLKLPLSDKRKCVYNLSSVLVHVGTSSSSGHYYSYVKSVGGKWFEMNDEYVRPCGEEQVLNVRDAYLLFYTRQEVKLDLPGLPNQVGEVSPQKIQGGMTTDEAKESVKEKKGRERKMSDTVEEETRVQVAIEEERVVEMEVEGEGVVEEKKKKKRKKKEEETAEEDKSVDGSVSSYAHGIAVKVKRYKFDKVRVAPAFTGGLGKFIPFGARPLAARNGFQIHLLCMVGEEEEEEIEEDKMEEEEQEVDDLSSSAPSSSESEDEDEEEEETQPPPPAQPQPKKKKKIKSKVKGSKALLGNVAVAGWSDSDSETLDHHVSSTSSSIKEARAARIAAEEAAALDRKRKLRKSNWDEKLDEGKRKKVKGKKVESVAFDKVGKDNPFFRQQSKNARFSGGKKGGQGKDYDRRKR